MVVPCGVITMAAKPNEAIPKQCQGCVACMVCPELYAPGSKECIEVRKRYL